MPKYYKIVRVEIVSEEDLCDEILRIVQDEDKKGLKNIIEQISYDKLDLSTYREGLIGIWAAQANEPKLLQMLCKHDNKLVKKHGVEMLSVAICYHKIDNVKFLLNSGVDPLELKNTTAYGYYQDLKHLVEENAVDTETESELSGDHLAID